MSKYVMLSFDDGRIDTYTNAVQFLRQYKLTGTINVVSDFVLHPESYSEFKTCLNHSMLPEQVLDCQRHGMEIACHGSTHQNDVEDIRQNLIELGAMGLDTARMGFASPHSELTASNSASVQQLLSDGALSYIRSGVQVRREGLIYTALTVLEQLSHSKRLFWHLNRNCVLARGQQTLLRSVTMTRYTTTRQLSWLLNRLNENEGIILIFHSILWPGELGFGADKWYWEATRFEELCQYLQSRTDITVCTTRQWIEGTNDVSS